MIQQIKISDRIVGEGYPTFIVAEMSGNHNGDFERAKHIIELAKDAGADAVKLQTYTADTITLDCDNEYFKVNHGTIWDGTTLHKLYKDAYTPWEWQPKLKEYAESIGLICFSSPFDPTSVDFLEGLDVPCYKIASFEINDIPLIRKIASCGKPIILATGIAKLDDIELAVRTCREADNNQIILLKCTSEYPAKPEDMNLRTIPNLAETFSCVSGLSDHSMGSEIAIAAVALGACVVEKHLTIRRSDGGPDSAFSMEYNEFKEMCTSIRTVEKALGRVTYDLTSGMLKEREFSRSLFAVKSIKKGDVLTENNIRSIRPGYGLHTKYYSDILGRTAIKDISEGTPLKWNMLSNDIVNNTIDNI